MSSCAIVERSLDADKGQPQIRDKGDAIVHRSNSMPNVDGRWPRSLRPVGLENCCTTNSTTWHMKNLSSSTLTLPFPKWRWRRAPPCERSGTMRPARTSDSPCWPTVTRHCLEVADIGRTATEMAFYSPHQRYALAADNGNSVLETHPGMIPWALTCPLSHSTRMLGVYGNDRLPCRSIQATFVAYLDRQSNRCGTKRSRKPTRLSQWSPRSHRVDLRHRPTTVATVMPVLW